MCKYKRYISGEGQADSAVHRYVLIYTSESVLTVLGDTTLKEITHEHSHNSTALTKLF